MGIFASNATVIFDGYSSRANVQITKSPLPYNDRRRFGNRLKRLYAYLGTLRAENYNHSTLAERINVKHPCGSVACAFGHAVISEKFKGLQARYRIYGDAKTDANGAVCDYNFEFDVISESAIREAVQAIGCTLENDEGDTMSAAADAYFGPGAWEVIFDEGAYVWDSATKRAVMNRIAKLAEKAYGVKVK